MFNKRDKNAAQVFSTHNQKLPILRERQKLVNFPALRIPYKDCKGV